MKFLNFDLIIINNIFPLNLYHRREFFNFYTQSMPHLFSNLNKRVTIILEHDNRFYRIQNSGHLKKN